MAAQKQVKYMIIDTFKGVDFTDDDMAVDVTRSPLAVNIIADAAGRPELRRGIKRKGISNIPKGMQTPSGHIDIIAFARHDDRLIIAAKTGLLACTEDGEGTLIAVHSFAKSLTEAVIFKMLGVSYIAGSGMYMKYTSDGGFAEVEGYIPTTTIGRLPAGGGTVYEAINLLTARRINSFRGDGSTKTFWLDGKADTTAGVTVKKSTDTGWETVAASEYTLSNAYRKAFGDYYGKVVFTTAPEDGEGVDNITIEFTADIPDASGKIKNCTIASAYGVGGDSRIFLSGNADEPNTDYMSGLYDPTYFPDTGFTKIGDDAPIYGYLKADSAQLIIKRAEEGESCIFTRTASLMETQNISGEYTETTAVFAVKEGISGIGAAAKNAVIHTGGDPMLLTPEGVYGIETSDVTDRRTAQLRSFYINRRLITEPLERAKLCTWGKYAVIAADKHVYVADTQQANANPEGYTGYEWYYWELPIDVTAIASIDGVLTIGTHDGLYAMKGADAGMEAYSDETDSKQGITAIWSTPILYGGDFMRYKTVSKRGTGILAKPFARGSGEILITTDKALDRSAGSYTTDILNWDDVDFDRFTFNMRGEPRVKVFPKKQRKVMFFQMAVRHTAADEGFGVAAMRIAYTVGGLTKKGN